MSMEQTWRWFGPHDPVSLADARQAGATGIITALHHLPTGEVWESSEILKRKNLVEEVGMTWSVAESIPIHENIKTRSGNYKKFLENYKQSITNISAAGVDSVCYNFMPVLDATRTDFDHKLPDGSIALLYHTLAFAAFELFILRRRGAEELYNEEQQKKAKAYLDSLSKHQIDQLTSTIIAGFPGVGENYTINDFQTTLDIYKEISAADLKANLANFLSEIIPVAEEAGVKMAIHPDDPPFSVLGLPRIVSNEDDIRDLLSVIDSPNNGLCLCAGSLGVLENNDLPGMVKRLGHRINFVHLRNVKREMDGSFYESDHLDGEVDMYSLVKAILEEQAKREKEGRRDRRMPMRPDHGHQMLDDINKKTIPGYSAIGRLRGLAEIRGLEMGILRAME